MRRTRNRCFQWLVGLAAAGVALALAVPAVAAPTPARERAPSTQASPQAPVDLNTATEADLTRIPGIGKALAQRIVEFREKNGPFEKVEDLIKVRGVGEKSFQKFRPHVTVSKPGK